MAKSVDCCRIALMLIWSMLLIGNTTCILSNSTSQLNNLHFQNWHQPPSKQAKQYSNSYAGSGYAASASPTNLISNPIEAILVGVLAVCGLGLFGIPLLFMLTSMLNLNSNPGISLIPTATTSVNSGKRKRRSTSEVNQVLFSKIVDSFNTFVRSEEKMQLLQRMLF